ncbi:MAG: cellulase family glycosylhydrolase [Bacteroidota bacterium]
MNKTASLILFVLLLSLPLRTSAGGFLKVSGTKIVNDNNEEVILRGMGLGGWHVPEGYMFGMSSFANAAWEIRSKIVEAVGPQNADTFFTAFRANFVTRKDIERLAQLGFNSVRMPMHYQFFVSQNAPDVWIESGFVVMDSLLRWCGDNKIYLILDLHAAPGGQSANNISDYNPSLPSLWDLESNRTLTVALWKKLATRYADQPWIGGYDILNEPAWNLGAGNVPLRNLYLSITAAIRQVDTNHIIFAEGNWYATDFGGLTPAWDKNLVYSFHKYWNTNDMGSINYLLALRSSENRPLWLGESGENSNTWFTDCISLMETNKIGWSWWTIKKFEDIAGPFSVPITPDYDNLLKYWKGQASKPTAAAAMKALMSMAEGLKLQNCVFRPDVIDALLRQPRESATKPFAANIVPGKIFAVNFDLGKNLGAYKDNDFQNLNNPFTAWNSGWSYRNDGVDIEKCSDGLTNGYNVGWTASGEYLNFTVNVQQSGNYNVAVRFAAPDIGGIIGVTMDNGTMTTANVTKTGGYQTWGTLNIGKFDLTAGIHQLRTTFFFGGFNFNFIDVAYVGPMSVGSEPSVPQEYLLGQNFPNPFNPVTKISYSVPSASHVSLRVFDMLGKEIAVLKNDQQSPGNYTVDFDALTLPSGIYYYRLTAGNFTNTKKMTMLK